MGEHRFGGGWTQIKLEVLREYLKVYLTALKHKPFQKLYIDAFAGSGECVPKNSNLGTIDGSAKIALDTRGFDRYIFIEHHTRRYHDLHGLCSSYHELDIRLHNGDANRVLEGMLQRLDRNGWRGVAFLDPYGLQLDWLTLTKLAKTQSIDVWYLFPLSGLYRQAARNFTNVDASKEAAIDRCLGTADWRQAFYKVSPQEDLFSDDPVLIRNANVDAIEHFVRQRLETIFPKVLAPLRLPKSGAPLFSLFFAVSNPSPKAIGVASKIAKHILDHA
jgi:three-Cys-motif partner protein